MRQICKRIATVGVILPLMLAAGVNAAHAGKIDMPALQPNEAAWGEKGVPLVIVFDVKVNQQVWTSLAGNVAGPLTAIGSLRNVSDGPIKNVTVTVGDHEDGDAIVYGSDSLLNVNLAPTDVWRWSVDPNKGPGYEVLGVCVDGETLTKISASK